MADGLAEAKWVWCLFREAVFADFNPSIGKRANDADVSIPTVMVLKDESQVIVDPAIVSVVDAKSIFDHLVRECTGGQCRRTALVLPVIRESMRLLQARCRTSRANWLPGRQRRRSAATCPDRTAATAQPNLVS